MKKVKIAKGPNGGYVYRIQVHDVEWSEPSDEFATKDAMMADLEAASSNSALWFGEPFNLSHPIFEI